MIDNIDLIPQSITSMELNCWMKRISYKDNILWACVDDNSAYGSQCELCKLTH